jgi:hypothetical protein
MPVEFQRASFDNDKTTTNLVRVLPYQSKSGKFAEFVANFRQKIHANKSVFVVHVQEILIERLAVIIVRKTPFCPSKKRAELESCRGC